MNKLLLLMLVEAREATEPLIRAIMLPIARTPTSMTGMLRTKCNPGITMRNKGIGSPSQGGIGKNLIGRPASGLASQLAHAWVTALGVSAASLISGNI